MFKRFASTGINVMVLVVAILVFVGAFFTLTAIGAAQKPTSIKILAARHDINIGDVLTPADLAEKTVFEDDNATLYVPVEEVSSVVGGYAALPMYAGQPVFRTSILAPGGEGYRLSAVLADYPGYSLFPLLLDASNVIAPDVTMFLPGDLVNVTLAIDTRPEVPTTPTPYVGMSVVVVPTPAATAAAEDSQKQDEINKNMPPLAKDLFPQGVRVIAVQGIPPKTISSSTDGSSDSGSEQQSAFANFDQPKILILLIPDASREILTLALQQGDMLAVSLLSRSGGKTAGFTYWDFEEIFKADRAEVLGLPAAVTTTVKSKSPITSTGAITSTGSITQTTTISSTLTMTSTNPVKP